MKKGITSIDEMVEEKFTFYVSTSVGQTMEYLGSQNAPLLSQFQEENIYFRNFISKVTSDNLWHFHSSIPIPIPIPIPTEEKVDHFP